MSRNLSERSSKSSRQQEKEQGRQAGGKREGPEAVASLVYPPASVWKLANKGWITRKRVEEVGGSQVQRLCES